MTKAIIVGYDGTNAASEAASWAAQEAVLRGCPLRIMSCYQIPAAGETMFGWTATEAYASLLNATKDSVQAIERVLAAARPELVITSEVAAGPPATALLTDVGPDDLVVVGASSHEGAAAFWLGSTPRHLVRHSPCPVAVIRGPASRGRPLRVVVGVDGSRSSDRAVEWAADEADRLHVDLVVVHAWWYMYVTTDNSPARDLTRIDGACVLERSVELARERCGVEVTGELVEFSPVPGILQSVTDGDLLVLGSRGRGAVISGLFGSTVNSVLEQAAVPVVVVPLPAEHD